MFDAQKPQDRRSGPNRTMKCIDVAMLAEAKKLAWSSALESSLGSIHKGGRIKVEHASELEEERDGKVSLPLLDADDGGLADPGEASGLDLG
nr:hypothetical protein [Propionibacterium freudenreichii]